MVFLLFCLSGEVLRAQAAATAIGDGEPVIRPEKGKKEA